MVAGAVSGGGEVIQFTVYGNPQPKGSAKAFAYIKDGKPMASVTAANNKTKPWQQTLSVMAQQHRPDQIYRGAVKLTLRFYFSRPKSVSVKKRPDHTVKPDLDKLVRTVGDALKGVIYSDDSKVTDIVTSKAYDDNPRVEIEIEGAE